MIGPMRIMKDSAIVAIACDLCGKRLTLSFGLTPGESQHGEALANVVEGLGWHFVDGPLECDKCARCPG